MNKRLVMGVFDSEKFWRDGNTALLPEIHDQGSSNMIGCMDELLFPFCADRDVLITRKKMNDCHKAYLNQIGFDFDSNSSDLEDCTENSGSTSCNIFETAVMENNISRVKKLVDMDTCLSPYAIIPNTLEMSRSLNICHALPQLEHVKTVNSKIYSNSLKKKLDLNAGGEAVYDSEQLVRKGLELLKDGAFLMKDEYGVSGKGNILVTSATILLKLAGYMKKQEDHQKHVRLLLEPFLDKQEDFSCNLILDTDGKIRISSMQKIVNNRFNYAGTCCISGDLYRILEEKGYFKTMVEIAEELYKDGYFGEIGIDSMILKDGNIVPLVEINARKTMGMVNRHINMYLEKFNSEGQLGLLTLGYTQSFEYEQLLSEMKKASILFELETGKGILPLSANTLLVNSCGASPDKGEAEICKGRLYYSAAAGTEEERLELIHTAGEFLKSFGFKIY